MDLKSAENPMNNQIKEYKIMISNIDLIFILIIAIILTIAMIHEIKILRGE